MNRSWLTKHAAPTLGDTEIAVLQVLWRDGRVDAKQVTHALDRRSITLSTVQSTLERLCRKGLVERGKQGRAYVYVTAVSRSVLLARLIGGIATQVSGDQMEPVLSGFVDLVTQSDPESLERLGELIARKRRERDDA